MLWGLIPLENELPIPAPFFGLIAFGILIAALLITHAIGNGRPHS